MRMIDADALRARMYHDAFETDSDMQKWDGGCWIRYKMFENAIEDAPTIEPVNVTIDEDLLARAIEHRRKSEERKKGKWILVREADEAGNAYYECSVCHKSEVHVPIVEVSYCWNCGAKME